MPITVSGTSITFNNGTVQTTAFTGATGVTSVATGNGLQGGTITTSGTLSVACPAFNTVGSYCMVAINLNSGTGVSAGSNYAAGFNTNQITTTSGGGPSQGYGGAIANPGLSGTWKWMAATTTNSDVDPQWIRGLGCRVS